MRHDVRNINEVSSLSIKFAKFMFRINTEGRLKVYYKLASLLKNGFNLSDALKRIWEIESKDGKKPDEPRAIAISAWLYEIQKGKPFADAIDGWAVSRERLMLMVGDVSRLESALMNLIHVSEGYKRILQPLQAAVAYPTFLICLTILLLIVIGLKMVPPMTEFFKGKDVGGVAGSLMGLSTWMQNNWFLIPPIVLGIGISIALSLPYARSRIRVFLDKIPPWSLYRMFNGVSFLLSLAAMVKAGSPLIQAVTMLKEGMSPYAKSRIDSALRYMRNGDNIGTALKKTNYHFPDDEIIGDLSIYSELDDFEGALTKLANDYLEEGIDKIKKQAQILNTFAMILITGMIFWLLLGIFDISNQIQNTF